MPARYCSRLAIAARDLRAQLSTGMAPGEVGAGCSERRPGLDRRDAVVVVQAVQSGVLAGYDGESPWAEVFNRDKAGEQLQQTLDRESASYRRLMESVNLVHPGLDRRMVE